MENTNNDLFQILSERDKTKLKRASYPSVAGKPGEVVYEIKGKKVIFSAIKSSREATSSVNAAERIIAAICNQEGIDFTNPSFFTDYEFYDLSTPIGYPDRKEDPLTRLASHLAGLGEVQLDKLNIVPTSNNYIYVESWTPIYLNSDNKPSQLEP